MTVDRGRSSSKRPDVYASKTTPASPRKPKQGYPSPRSWTMAQVRSKNTKPEVAVRKAAHGLGLRFRLHRKGLPGTADLVFASRRIALFVHGCFWHRHSCGRASVPASNIEYWAAKFDRNVRRDALNAAALRKSGWRYICIWECETKDVKKLARILRRKIAMKPKAS